MIKINELIARYTGYVGVQTSKGDAVAFVPGQDAAEGDYSFPVLNTAEKQSLLGTPIFFPCRIGISKADMFDLPNEPMINISGTNRIIKTELTKLQGSVKERVQLSDYAVTISGIIINEDSEDYPAEMVAKIRTVCENAICYVESDLLKVFNITQLAIEKFSFPFRPNSQNEQDYTISAISDRPIELIINQKV